MAFPILGSPNPQFSDSSGSPYASGTLSVLDPADDTNKASYPTYDDAEAATNANANPITLDARGSCTLWGLDNEDYKLVLKDSSGATVWTTDDIFLPNFGQYYAVTAAETSAGVTPTNYQYEPGNVLRYGTNTTPGTTDMTTSIQNALNSNDKVFLPTGNYSVTSQLTINSNNSLTGERGSKITSTLDDSPTIKGTAVTDVSIYGIEVEGAQGTTDWPSPSSNAEGLVHFINSGATNCERIRIEGCHLHTTWCPISCIEVEGLWIQGNICHNFMRYGILASKSVDFHIDNNTVYDSNTTGAVAYGIMATGDNAGGSIQARCTISNNSIREIQAWDGIMSHDVSKLSVIGNIIEDVRRGIDIGHLVATNVVEDLIVSGNVIELTTVDAYSTVAAAHDGIAIAGYDASNRVLNATITGNIVKGHGNLAAGATLAGNPASITLNDIDNLSCVGNIISGADNDIQSSPGIFLIGTINRCLVNSNSIEGDVPSGGIRASGLTSDVLTIVGNHVVQTTTSNNAVVISGSTIAKASIGMNATNCTAGTSIGTSTIAFNNSSYAYQWSLRIED